MAIFFLGSLAASLAQTALQLIIFRAFTGVGGGGLMTVAQMIVSDVVPLRERGKYQGILGAVVALANGIGPVIGGALAGAAPEQESWRWIFRLNLPLTALTTLCVFFFMPLRRVEGNWRVKLKAVDFMGVFLALAGTAVLLLGLNWGGGEYAWDSAHVVATLVVGAAVFAGFVGWQWKGARVPLVPMHIFRSRIVNGACLSMFVNGWNFLVQVYYIPAFYQLVFGYSTVKAGAMLLPITLMQSRRLSRLYGCKLTSDCSIQQHALRPGCALGRPVSRMHSLRLGCLGNWPRAVLDAGPVLWAREADRIWDFDWRGRGEYLAAVSAVYQALSDILTEQGSHRRPSRRHKKGYGGCHQFPEVRITLQHIAV